MYLLYLLGVVGVGVAVQVLICFFLIAALLLVCLFTLRTPKQQEIKFFNANVIKGDTLKR